ncbi:MAG: hypothetical protein AAF604_12140 [Acidobacteriota bacterium]
MAWFRRKAPAPTVPTEPTPEIHPSPALGLVFAELENAERLSILDLGPAMGENLDYFSQRFPCRLQVADLYRSLHGEDPVGQFRRLIDLQEPPDLVLAWDLPSYLPRETTRSLFRHLAEQSAAGTRVFTMIASHAQMPLEPGSFVLRGEADLEYRYPSTKTRPTQRLPPAELANLAPQYRVDRSFLLRHGFQEYVLVQGG